MTKITQLQSHKKIKLIQLGSERYMVCTPVDEAEFHDYSEAMNYYTGLVRLHYRQDKARHEN